MSASPRAVLARWQPTLELLAVLPPAITANLINARLLADVARVTTPDETPVELRVLLLWAARNSPARVADHLSRELVASVPGAEPVLAELTLPTDTPAAVVRERFATAHALVITVDYYELTGSERDPGANARLAAARGRLAQAAGWLTPGDISIVVVGRVTERSDPASRRDWIHQKAVEELGLAPGWPAGVIVDIADDDGPHLLAARVLRPFREGLAESFTAATFAQVRHAVSETELSCREIRKLTDITQPVSSDRRWTWLQALSAGRLAETMAKALQAGDPGGRHGAGASQEEDHGQE